MHRWTFESGHTAAEFCVRHVMVTEVRGHFKNAHGTLEFDPELPTLSFAWTAKAETILAKVARARAVLDTSASV